MLTTQAGGPSLTYIIKCYALLGKQPVKQGGTRDPLSKLWRRVKIADFYA